MLKYRFGILIFSYVVLVGLCTGISEVCTPISNTVFKVCTKAGYNQTLQFPEEMTPQRLQQGGRFLNNMLARMENCSQTNVAEAMGCSSMVPKCLQGKRVYPCKRVCGEFLKQCAKDLPETVLDYIVAACHVLPKDSCFEPPNFTTNESIAGPLDRDCQELIIPACKNLGVYNQTYITAERQKKIYSWFYQKEYKAGEVEQDFPVMAKKLLAKYPKCEINIKKLFCGETLPPCFPLDNKGQFSLCRSLCDDIARDCPEFFRNDFLDAEFCAQLPDGNTSHGFCRREDWPSPFLWLRYMPEHTYAPSPEPTASRSKTWAIVVAVVVPLIAVAVLLAAVICWKWRRTPRVGYKKHTDRDDTTPMET